MVVLEKTPSINIVSKIGGYFNMRTLEEIALERLKRRKDYEKRNGKGTFVRSNIAHLEGKTVPVSGVVKSKTGDRFTLVDVIVDGVSVHHINIILEGDTRLRRTIMSCMHQRISFSAKVQKYYSKGRYTYGLVKVRKIMPTEIYRKRALQLSLKNVVRDYAREDFRSDLVPSVLFEKDGFSQINVGGSLGSVDRGTLQSALSLQLRSELGFYTEIEKELIQLLGVVNPLELASILHFVRKRRISPKYHELYRLILLTQENELLHSLHSKVLEQTYKFLSYWSNGSYTILKPDNRLLRYYGIPVMYQSKDGSILVIIPKIGNSKFKSWKAGSIIYLLSLLNAPKGTSVTFYNPIQNQILCTRTK